MSRSVYNYAMKTQTFDVVLRKGSDGPLCLQNAEFAKEGDCRRLAGQSAEEG